jgi:Family of unknown function (DUF6232)
VSNRTYYRGPSVVVTDLKFVAHAETTRTFAVRELRNVRIATNKRLFRAAYWELLANYRGIEVVLLKSADERSFHQVSRALRRAIEDARPSKRAATEAPPSGE